MFEALNRLAWVGFESWTEEHHEEKKSLVDEFFKRLDVLKQIHVKKNSKPPWQAPHFKTCHNCSTCILPTSGILTASSPSPGCLL